MNMSGRIVAIDSTQQVTDRFRKRTFVIETDDPKYPQTIQCELGNDRCELMDAPRRVGDQIDFDFEIRGRKWSSKDGVDKYFVSINVFKIRLLKASADPFAASGGGHDQPPLADSDIPFVSADVAHEPSASARVLR